MSNFTLPYFMDSCVGGRCRRRPVPNFPFGSSLDSAIYILLLALSLINEASARTYRSAVRGMESIIIRQIAVFLSTMIVGSFRLVDDVEDFKRFARGFVITTGAKMTEHVAHFVTSYTLNLFQSLAAAANLIYFFIAQVFVS